MRGNLKSISNRRFDVINNPMQALEHVFVAITFFQIALRSYDSASIGVVLFTTGMHRPIKLNCNARFKTNEVNDESFNRKLAAKFVTIQFSIP